MQSGRTFALWLFLFCLISPLAVTQVYKVTDLGPLAPTAINNWGQVAGNRNGHAFIWTKWGSLDLGTLAGGTFSRAAAINDFGAVSGTADGPGTVISHNPSLPNKDCSNLTQPFVWTPTNGIHGLGATVLYGEEGGHWCDIVYFATDIDFYGHVVGSNQEYFSYKWGFLWTGSDGMTLFADDYQTAVNGINNVAQVVGQTGVSSLAITSHAALWDYKAKTDLGTLGGDSTDWSYCSGANSINDLGQVVGWSSTRPDYLINCGYVARNLFHAFLWKAGAAMQDLGTLPGDTSSMAREINLFGQVIGSSGNTAVWQDNEPGGSIEVIGRPFIWSERSGMRDLNALIPANSGWVLNSATGINFRGQIVGSGTRNGKPHGFLLTPRL